MKSVIVCAFFIAAAWALPKGQNGLHFRRLYVDPSVEGLPLDSILRITNGREAEPHSIPYQAYLIVTANSGQRWACGGSLISPTHVLTAAHCVMDSASADVYLGAHNIQQYEESRKVIQSRNLIPHEEYDDDTISNDIGLIAFDEPVELNEYISTIELASAGASKYEGANARISGWGLTSGDGDVSNVLLEVNATVISNSECKSIYGIVIDSQLCTAGDNGVGSCSGDSGGPLVTDNHLIGVVSYGSLGCLPGYPSGFTRVTSYLDWISKNTGLTFGNN